MDIRFLAPGFLLLLLLVPAVWFVPRRATDTVHALLRSLVLVFVVFALARPVVTTDDSVEHHAVVLDRTASLATGVARADELAAGVLDALPSGARSTLVELGPAGVEPAPGWGRRSVHTGDGSALGEALELAGRAIPRGARGAVTLVTDGLATEREWGAAATDLESRGIPVHAIALAPPAGDVYPVSLVPEGELVVGVTARVRVDVVGDADVDISLITSDGEVASLAGVACDGRVSAVLEFEPDRSGFLELVAEVTVVGGSDTRPGNESFSRTVAVQDPRRVLYLGQRMAGGADKLGSLVGPGFEIVEGVPSDDSARLGEYSLAIVDDCPATAVPDGVQSELARAVAEDGLGLMFTGGTGSFGPGGWHETTLSEILPVESIQKEEKRDPSTTLCVIIDTSGSMGGNRVQLAKEVARLAIRRLLPHDKVGIVEFYGAKRWAAPIQPASNSIELERALNRLDAGGGTVILPAIEEAFYGMQNIQTRYKHVLVLTDGGVETGAFEPLLRRMADEGMNVSTVLIGPDAHSEFLVTLSNWGKGRFYSVPNRFNLPEILLKQPTSAKLPAYRPGVHAVRSRGGSGWWGDVDPKTVPALAGYVETRARPGAERVLETVEGGHPVVASWRYGLGRVTTFASEPTGPGTAGWGDWPGYGPFLARVLERTAADSTEPFRYSIARHADEITVTAERRAPSVASSPTLPAARVLDGEEPGEELDFRERAPGLFTAVLGVPRPEEVRVLCGASPGTARFRLVSPPGSAPELSVDPARSLDLAGLARATGGTRVDPADARGFRPTVGGGTAPIGLFELGPPCLLIALFVYLADLFHRRRPGLRVNP